MFHAVHQNFLRNQSQPQKRFAEMTFLETVADRTGGSSRSEVVAGLRRAPPQREGLSEAGVRAGAEAGR